VPVPIFFIDVIVTRPASDAGWPDTPVHWYIVSPECHKNTLSVRYFLDGTGRLYLTQRESPLILTFLK